MQDSWLLFLVSEGGEGGGVGGEGGVTTQPKTFHEAIDALAHVFSNRVSEYIMGDLESVSVSSSSSKTKSSETLSSSAAAAGRGQTGGSTGKSSSGTLQKLLNSRFCGLLF